MSLALFETMVANNQLHNGKIKLSHLYRQINEPVDIVTYICMHNWKETIVLKLEWINWKLEEFSVPHGIFFSWKDMFESIGQIEVILRADHIEEAVGSLEDALKYDSTG